MVVFIQNIETAFNSPSLKGQRGKFKYFYISYKINIFINIYNNRGKYLPVYRNFVQCYSTPCFTYTVTTWEDRLLAGGGMSFSTIASLEKPNLDTGSLLSRLGKSVSTSPSSSAIWRQYISMFSLQSNTTKILYLL